eukprot:COSAG01_NODE_68_length_28978_cov_182.027777_31_plen_523_part_00
MPPRPKRKRSSNLTSPAGAPASHRTRSSSKAAVGEDEAQAEVPVLVPIKGERLPTLLASQRSEGHFLDTKLAVGDACIAAHRVVLAAYSPYLKGLFTSGLAESSEVAASSEAPVVIRGVDGAAVAACVDCMYSGSIALTGATVCAVIHASNLLQVASIEEAACAFFVGRLEPDTALDALGFAEGMAVGGTHGKELHVQVLAYVHENFEVCAASLAFVSLAPPRVAALIGSGKLCVQSEEVVLSALRRWYEHDVEGRVGALEELVPLVRFPLLPAEARLRLGSEPLLLALGKLDVPKLAQLLLEFAPEFKNSAAASGCPRLKRRTGNGQVFTFASVDNSNASRGVRRGVGGGGRFDEAGVLHFIATEGGTSPYVNPHTAGRVVASCSSECTEAHTVDRFVAGPYEGEFATANNPNSWVAVDLGAGRRLTVNHYALRHGVRYHTNCLRNWELQGSEDGLVWTTLRRHDDDRTIVERSWYVAFWEVEGVTTPYRHFRVHQHGRDSSGDEFLVCSGIELYGTLDRV